MRSRPPSRTARPGRPVSALKLLLLCIGFCGCCLLAAVYWHSGSLGAAAPGSAHDVQEQQGRKLAGEPDPLAYPLWWHAPVLSSSGLGTEALALLMSLVDTRQVRPQDIFLSHSGDANSRAVLDALSPATRSFLLNHQHPQLYADEYMPVPTWSQLMAQQQQQQQQKQQKQQQQGPRHTTAHARLSLTKGRAAAAAGAGGGLQGSSGRLLGHLDKPLDPRRMVAVCHNWHECWRVEGQPPSNMHGCPCPFSKSQVVYRVARTMFETAGLPQDFAAHCNAMDEVWVPSQFNVDSFAAAGVERSKLHIVPEALDAAEWDPARYRPLRDMSLLALQPVWGNTRQHATKPFVFLSVFKWEERKGWRELLLAFAKAFTPDDNVELVILTKPFLGSGTNFAVQMQAWASTHVHLSQQEMAQALPRVWVGHTQLSEDTYRRLLRSVGALVVASHGEGWGRPQMEAMALEVPVITTNWSGPTAFMDDSIAYMAPIDGLVTVQESGPHFFMPFVGQRWAQPSVVGLARLMKRVVTHRGEARAKAVAARRHIQEHFSPQVLAAAVGQNLQRIQRLLKQREGGRRGASGTART